MGSAFKIATNRLFVIEVQMNVMEIQFIVKENSYKLLGDTEEGNPSKKYDPYLEMEVLYFEKETVFKQKIKVLSKEDFAINGTIDYIVCLTQCVNSDEEFSFKVKRNPGAK